MAHLNYYLDLCAETFIVNAGAVLLRLHDKYSIWTGPGGHIDPGEDANEAAIREAWEETGLTIELIGPQWWSKSDSPTNRDLVPPLFCNRHKINEHHDHAAFIFIGKSDTRDINPQTEADKGVACIWVTKEELDHLKATDSRLREETYRYANMALELVKN